MRKHPSFVLPLLVLTLLVLPSVAGRKTSVQDLARFFPFRAENGYVRVSSDIGATFSSDHAAHANLVWNYFSRLFARSVGRRTEFYYTRDNSAYDRALELCPSTVVAGGRRVTACYDNAEGIYRWFIVPYVTPDYGTQQHELSHSFLYATFPASEDFPWFKEGTGMYWESGSFDESGNLVVSEPMPYLVDGIRRWRGEGRLLPLSALLVLPRDRFYASEPTLVYSEAGLFVFFLMRNYSAPMQELFVQLNERIIVNNNQVVAFLTNRTGLSLQELDRAFLAFVARYG